MTVEGKLINPLGGLYVSDTVVQQWTLNLFEDGNLYNGKCQV